MVKFTPMYYVDGFLLYLYYLCRFTGVQTRFVYKTMFSFFVTVTRQVTLLKQELLTVLELNSHPVLIEIVQSVCYCVVLLWTSIYWFPNAKILLYIVCMLYHLIGNQLFFSLLQNHEHCCCSYRSCCYGNSFIRFRVQQLQ